MARGFWDLLDPHFIDGDGAESFAQFIARAQSALDRLRARPESFIVVFSHAIFMRALLWLALSRPARIDREAMLLFHHFSLSLDVPNCGVLPLLLGSEGPIYAGTIADPIGASITPPTAEQIRLSGL
jgi:broad specificity phosphatase PhoE